MGDVAHSAAACRHRKAEQALLAGHVEQFVFDPVATACIHNTTDQQVVLVERAPGRVIDLAAAGWTLDQISLA